MKKRGVAGDISTLVRVQLPSPALKTNHRLLEIIVCWSLALSE